MLGRAILIATYLTGSFDKTAVRMKLVDKFPKYAEKASNRSPWRRFATTIYAKVSTNRWATTTIPVTGARDTAWAIHKQKDHCPARPDRADLSAIITIASFNKNTLTIGDTFATAWTKPGMAKYLKKGGERK